jgi:hypothetical protein
MSISLVDVDARSMSMRIPRYDYWNPGSNAQMIVQVPLTKFTVPITTNTIVCSYYITFFQGGPGTGSGTDALDLKLQVRDVTNTSASSTTGVIAETPMITGYRGGWASLSSISLSGTVASESTYALYIWMDVRTNDDFSAQVYQGIVSLRGQNETNVFAYL